MIEIFLPVLGVALLSFGIGCALGSLLTRGNRRDELAEHYLRGFAAGRRSERAETAPEVSEVTRSAVVYNEPAPNGTFRRSRHDSRCSVFRPGAQCDCVARIPR